jgi:hypothetical protein
MRDLIAAVGEERFRDACEWATATAAGAGRSRGRDPDAAWRDDVVNVPHDLAGQLWEGGEGTWSERLGLAFDLYRVMPCYATLMYMRHSFFEWDEATRDGFWAEYGSLLSDPDDRLAHPIAYSLWCDYFEDSATVGQAWTTLEAPGVLSDLGLRRALDASGPVPYTLKARTYERLRDNSIWHPSIFRSLLRSAYDVYGKIDAKAATRLLDQLSLPRTTDGLAELREKLKAESGPARRRAEKPGRTDRRRPKRS